MSADLDDNRVAKHFLEEEIKSKCLELAEYFEDYDIVEYYIHVHKSKKDVKIHPKLIETEKNNP